MTAEPTNRIGAAKPHGWMLLSRTDTLAGLVFIAAAVFALWVSWGYPIGTALRMGTGYVPRLLSWILLGLGVLVIVQDLWTRAEEPAADSEALSVLKPMLFVTAAIVVFGLTIERLGLVIAIILMVGTGSLAGKDKRWVETLITSLVMALASVAIFVWGLGLTIPIWPEW